MLNLNCLLADLVNKIRVAEQYGLCDDRYKVLLSYVSSYQWLYNNAWDCLEDVDKKDIENFVNCNWNCKSFTMCTANEVECADTPLPLNDDCSGAITIDYPQLIRPYTPATNESNSYVCGVVDYPSNSGLPYPDSWDLDSSGDLWYTFNTSDSLILSPYITIYNGTMVNPQMALYSGADCGGLSFVKDGDHGTSSTNWMQVTLETDSTYYLRVSNGGGNINTGSFDIFISMLPII